MKVRAVAIVGTFLGAPLAWSADIGWNTGTGAWGTGGNWTGGASPGSSDSAYVGNNGTVQVNGTYTVQNLQNIGHNGSVAGPAGAGTVDIQSGSINAGEF